MLISNCCGAELETHEEGLMVEDGICKKCKEHASGVWDEPVEYICPKCETELKIELEDDHEHTYSCGACAHQFQADLT